MRRAVFFDFPVAEETPGIRRRNFLRIDGSRAAVRTETQGFINRNAQEEKEEKRRKTRKGRGKTNGRGGEQKRGWRKERTEVERRRRKEKNTEAGREGTARTFLSPSSRVRILYKEPRPPLPYPSMALAPAVHRSALSGCFPPSFFRL